MLYLVSFTIIILNLFNKNNKWLFYFSIIFLWILAGWSYGTADYLIYNNLYNWSSDIYQISNTEIGFSSMMRICNALGLDFQQFLILIFGIGLVLVGYTIKKYSDIPNVILALFFIYSFIINVTQFRQFLATSIFVFSFQFLLVSEKKSYKKYIIGILLASTIHFSAIFMLLLLIPYKFNTKKVILITGISIFTLSLLYVLSSSGYITTFLNLFNIKLNSKISSIIEGSANNYSLNYAMKWTIDIIVFFILFVIIQYIGLHLKRNTSSLNIGLDALKVNTSLILKSNIILLIIVPLTFVSADIYRIQHMMIIWNYIAIGSLFDVKIAKLTTTRKNVILVTALLLFAFWNLRGLVLSNNNINTVFAPLFENNLFFK